MPETHDDARHAVSQALSGLGQFARRCSPATRWPHAVVNRRPPPGIIFHTDRGIEYAAYAFRTRLAALGFVQSMNRPREVTDNAHMESFFHSMKTDVVHGVSFVSPDDVGRLLRSYLPYYNRVRLHSGLGYRSPVDYEAQRA
jgi:putative transposase